MKKKLNCILLIDDDEATNFIHKLVIKKADCAKEVVTMESGYDALDYLTKTKNGVYPQPDIIFLDINMPAMDGWEFLQEYAKLEEDQKGHVVLVMLTTSLNPDDEAKAKNINHVNGFKNKPLSTEMIMDIIKEHFPQLI
jgi:CheY-like chemotaxis protein